MFPIDVTSAAPARPAPPPAGVPGYFTEGDAVAGTPATIVSAEFLNMVQDELAAILADAGVNPDKSNSAQVIEALHRVFATTSYVDAQRGNFPGFYQIVASAALTAAAAGKVIVLGGGGTNTCTLPSGASMPDGGTFYFFAQGATWVLQGAGSDVISVGSATGGGAVSSISITGSDFCTLSWRAAGGWIVTAGGPLMARGDSTVPMKPKTASGIGQWAPVIIGGSTITLPAGGTWAYFAANSGSGYSGVAAGGSAIYSGSLNNAFGFAWRIA